MTTSWSLLELRAHIERQGVDVQRRLAVLGSLDRYVAIFRYHLISARDAMNGVVYKDDPHGIKNSQYIFGGGDRQEEFAHARIVSEAHVLGSIHSVRALWDVFAFLVNEVVLDSKVRERSCDLSKVWKALPPSTLKSDIGRLLDSYWFGYVTAFINTSKHRFLVPHAFHVCFESDHSGIRIEGFIYEKESYPPYWARDLLEGVLGVKNRIIDCGRILNWQLIGSTV